MKSLTKRLTIMIVIVFVIGALGYLTQEVRSMQWLIDNESRMRDYVRDYPWQSWILGLGVYTAFSIVPGTSGKSVVWGWIFGFWPAVFIVDIGLSVAAVGSFVSSRFLFRDMVKSRFRELVTKLDHSLDHDGAFYLLVMRVAHVPFTFVNYGAGATSVSLGTFAWTTMLGLLPGTMIFVFVGTRIPTLEKLAKDGIWQLLDPLLISLLVATFVFPFLVRWAMRKYRGHRGEEPELSLSEIEALPE